MAVWSIQIELIQTAREMTATHKKKSAISAEGGLRGLIEGNDRFMHGAARFPTICKETLADHARGQQPYATILGCSDSRVPPELIFDANFGELFYRARCGERNVARGHGKSAVRCLVKELGTREVPDVACFQVADGTPETQPDAWDGLWFTLRAD